MKLKVAVYLFLLLLLASLGLAACGKTDEQKVMDAVNKYIDAVNSEDVDAVQAALHRDNWSYFYVKQQLPSYFALYDVKTVLEETRFEGITDGVATVDFVMTTRSINKSDFKDTRIKGKFTLKQQGDEWKILSTDYDPETDIEYLTPEP